MRTNTPAVNDALDSAKGKRTQADREFDWSTGRELERKDAEIDRLRAPWRAVDGMDWEYLFSALGYGGRDQFWRVVLTEMRLALTNAVSDQPR